MIRILRSLVDWLEKKFPDKLVVTVKDYQELKARLEMVDPAKIKRMEQEISKFNMHLGFGGGAAMPKGMATFPMER